MSSQAIKDYLTKQIFIEKNIVTYRSLSREREIHVNAAKNELAAYHKVAPFESQIAFATYLVSGELLPQTQDRTNYDEDGAEAMDVDEDLRGGDVEDAEWVDEGESVPQTTIMLVNETELEEAKAKFARIDDIHVYSLSPSRIHDAGLLCAPTDIVRSIDEKRGLEFAAMMGKVIGSHVRLKKKGDRQPIAGPSRTKSRNPAFRVADKPPGAKDTSDRPAAQKEKKTKTEKLPEKSKLTGKLDFSKAKPKEARQTESKELKKPKAEEAKTSNVELSEKKKDEPKRGMKRKSALTLSEEDEDDPPANKAGVSAKAVESSLRIKNRTVLSDEEEDGPASRIIGKARNPKPRALGSDDEKAAEALMDVDDDHVERVPRGMPQPPTTEEEDAATDHDVAMSDASEEEEKPKPKKRAPKKVAPVGRNGLKKKRVMKTRTALDDKGYMITEDYSSYESVDEEAPVIAKTKEKRKQSAGMKDTNDQNSIAESKAAAKAKGTAASKGKSVNNNKGKQKSLTTFFTARGT